MEELNRDYIAEAIADYEAMNQKERGKMIASLLEDQPVLMGFITNVADDFSESEHETLVDSAVILINAFVAAGIPLRLIPHKLVQEVIEEKVQAYDTQEEELTQQTDTEISDSPIAFEDLRKRAIYKSNLSENNAQGQHNFALMLDTIISIIECMAAIVYDQKQEQKEQ